VTPAETLNAAATKLREAATAARTSVHHVTSVPETPWTVVECADYCPCIVVQGSDEPPDEYLADAETPELAAYIALMHPGVGLALADWLDSLTGIEVNEHGPMDDEYRHALATARALLGEVTG